jgi:hypothetical protein
LSLLGHPESTGTERDLVKVATFNVNNINKRLDNLLAWLAKAEPAGLQEIKMEQGAFSVDALRTLGYEAVWRGERSWNRRNVGRNVGTDGTFTRSHLAHVNGGGPSLLPV